MNEIAFDEFSEKERREAEKGTQLATHQDAPTPRITPRETLDFQLVRSGKGELLELATPLLGLCSRVRGASHYHSVEELHARVKNEIQNFSSELETAGYDKATIQAARYCMCTMVDESVMSQDWGAESSWSENTMLSIYHNETWGGEKFYAILDRVINDASRFPDLLEFQYLCMLLGFEGKYHVAHNGKSKLEHLMRQVNDLLLEKNMETPQPQLTPEKNVVHERQTLKKRLSALQIVGIAFGILAIIFMIFTVLLAARVNSIGSGINETFEEFRLEN